MEQPWIHKSKTDFWLILFPAFFVLGIVFVFQDWLSEIQEDYSFYTWLFLIVFIDVAHVYATLFKTYFVKSEFQRRKKLYIGLPIICFLIGLFLFGFGSSVFWSVLAYVAVFHFVRQQYGFVRLYARKEEKTKGMEQAATKGIEQAANDDATNSCNYPDCLFAIGGPPLDVCQGSCGGRRCFHHACNVNWVEREGIDAELRKLCYDCVKIEYV